MSIIFDSIKTRNLDQVYEINLNQYYQHLVSDNIDKAGVDDADFSVRVASGIARPEFNAVVQTDISDNFDTIFPEIKEYFGNKSLPYTWYIIPSSDTNEIHQKLESSGLRYIGDDVVLGVELESMVRNISSPNSLYIEAVDNYEKLETWVDLYTKTRNIKGKAVEQLKTIYIDADFTNPDLPYRKYIGWLNGEPVTCSTLVTSGGIAVVYDETLIPRYRDFGIQEAINITPLKKAREQGYKLGLIPTTIGDIKRFTYLEFKELFRVKKLVHIERGRRQRRRRR